jgi:hypothetical protein
MTTVPSGNVALVGNVVARVQPPAVAGAPPTATDSVWPTEPVIWSASVSPACVRNAGRAGVGHADVDPTVAGNCEQGPTLRISGNGVVGLLIPPLALEVTLIVGVAAAPLEPRTVTAIGATGAVCTPVHVYEIVTVVAGVGGVPDSGQVPAVGGGEPAAKPVMVPPLGAVMVNVSVPGIAVPPTVVAWPGVFVHIALGGGPPANAPQDPAVLTARAGGMVLLVFSVGPAAVVELVVFSTVKVIGSWPGTGGTGIDAPMPQVYVTDTLAPDVVGTDEDNVHGAWGDPTRVGAKVIWYVWLDPAGAATVTTSVPPFAVATPGVTLHVADAPTGIVSGSVHAGLGNVAGAAVRVQAGNVPPSQVCPTGFGTCGAGPLALYVIDSETNPEVALTLPRLTVSVNAVPEIMPVLATAQATVTIGVPIPEEIAQPGGVPVKAVMVPPFVALGFVS